MNSAQDLWNSCVTDINEIYLRDASFCLSQHPQLREQALEAIDGGANSFEVVDLGARRRVSWWQLALWSKDVDMMDLGLRHQTVSALHRPRTELSPSLSLMEWIMSDSNFSPKEHRTWARAMIEAIPDCVDNPQAALWVFEAHQNDVKSILTEKLATMAQQGWNMSLALDALKSQHPSLHAKIQEMIAQRQLHHLSQSVTAEHSLSRPKKI